MTQKTRAVWANLDQEARWAHVALPAAIQRKLAALSSLLSVLVDDEAVTVYASASVDASRLVAQTRGAGWTPPAIEAGEPARWDLAWAEPSARAVNDRRFGLALAERAGWALPSACTVTSLGELESHLASGGAAASPTRRWVCKAPWTAAGRDRCLGTGNHIDPEARASLTALLRTFGALVFEPWLDRTHDLGVCGRVAGERITVEQPHRLLVDDRGRFVGISLDAALAPAQRAELTAAAEAVGAALAREGFQGAFGIDAFLYRDGEAERLHPVCEINARHTFGHVARALERRLGTRTLGFGTPPAAATVLIRPIKGDSTTAWVQ
jgi:hypothetical protein